MKTFYSAEDIEKLAGQGVHELLVDDDTVLTSVAREVAAHVGVKLVTPGQRNTAAAASPATRSGNPAKPRGCQHGPLGSTVPQVSSANRTAHASGSPVVDDLIGAVKQLAQRG